MILPQKSVKNDIFKAVKQVKCLAIPMKTIYNISNKTALAEPSLKRNIVPDAKRNQNFTHFRGRAQSHSLWRYLSHSSVLQKVETEVAFAKKGSSTFQTLSSSRTAGRRLSDNVIARSEMTKQSHNSLSRFFEV